MSDTLSREQVETKLAYLQGTGLPTQVKCVSELSTHDAALRAMVSELEAMEDIHEALKDHETIATLRTELERVTALREHWEALADEYMTRIQDLQARLATARADALEEAACMVDEEWEQPGECYISTKIRAQAALHREPRT